MIHIFMAKKKLKDYLLRTLSFYQAEGGVYSEIITVLLKMRQLPGYRSMQPPARILNEAVYYWDVLCEGKDSADRTLIDGMDMGFLIMSVLVCLSAASLDEGCFITQELKSLLANDTQYYPHFAPIVEKYEKVFEDAYAELHGESLTDILKKQEEELDKQRQLISYQKDFIQSQDEKMAELSLQMDQLREENIRIQTVMNKQSVVSDFDRYLSLDTILEWIKGRQHYNYTEHVFRMLADMKDKRATDEERDKIRELETEMLGKNVGSSIHNTNYAFGSNLMTGYAQSPWMPIGVNPEEFQEMFEKFLKSMSDGQGQV